MKFAPLFAHAVFAFVVVGCSSTPAPADAGGVTDASPSVDAAVDSALDAARDATPDAAGRSCLPAGAPCVDPFKCCSLGCLVEATGNVCD